MQSHWSSVCLYADGINSTYIVRGDNKESRNSMVLDISSRIQVNIEPVYDHWVTHQSVPKKKDKTDLRNFHFF